MTVIGLVFVVAGGWGISQGSVGLGVAAVLFFGACLLFGILNWWSTEAELRGTDSEATTKAFVIALLGISVLLGLGCLAAFGLALIGWDQFSFATTVMFPRALVLVAGLVGGVFFIGGPIVLVLRNGRPFGTKDPGGENAANRGGEDTKDPGADADADTTPTPTPETPASGPPKDPTDQTFG